MPSVSTTSPRWCRFGWSWLTRSSGRARAGRRAPYTSRCCRWTPRTPARAALGQAAGPAAPAGEVASSEDYVDLGSLILDDEEEKTTRFVVAYEEPSGDEQANFAKMLSQFKAKVAENLSADDVKAHQDLGTAYKEMGLIDEAISEFQQALRASADHLPTYELLGQCFMEKGEPEAAVRTLKRALEAPFEVEDELLGIYLLARLRTSGAREQHRGGGVLRPRVFPGHQLRGRHGAAPNAPVGAAGTAVRLLSPRCC